MSWSSVASTVPFGGIAAADGWRYNFTAPDLAWACRFAMGEKESAAHTSETHVLLWTMANRMYRLWPRYPTFWQMLIAYSIALHGEYTPRRAWAQSLEPHQIPAAVMQRVVEFLSGTVQPGMARAFVHFGACGQVGFDLGPPAWSSPSGECYWRSTNWSGNDIWAVPGRPSTGSIATPLLIGASAILAYLLLVKLTGSKTLGLAALLLPP